LTLGHGIVISNDNKTQTTRPSPVMDQKEIAALLDKELKRVEKSIMENFQSPVAIIPLISGYLANGGGKRIRPMLVLLTSRLCGYKGGDDIVHSTVVEYIHAATLLHDDVVDSSDTRRGKISANAKWGNGYSVLVGDYLFAKSFSMMAEKSSNDIINAVSEATKYLAEGEILQLAHNCDLELDEKKYMDIVFRKTGALITACCRIGSLLGKADAEKSRALEEYGRNIGIAFQLADDVLDFTADAETLGKPVGHDLLEGHITLPFIHTMKNADDSEREFLTRSMEDGESVSRNMDEVIYLVKKYNGVRYTLDLAQQHSRRAMEALAPFEPGIYLDALKGLAQYVTSRPV